MQFLSRFLTPVFRFVVRRPDWFVWVYALLAGALEWHLHGSWSGTLNVLVANFIGFHLLGRYGHSMAFVFAIFIFDHFRNGAPLRVFTLSDWASLFGVGAIFAGFFAMAFAIGYLDDRFFKPQVERSGQHSPRALKLGLTIFGLTSAYVFAICLATGML